MDSEIKWPQFKDWPLDWVGCHVSRHGLVVRHSAGKRKDEGSSPRFGSPFSSKIVIYGHRLVTLPCTVNETVKLLTSLPILTRKSFWW